MYVPHQICITLDPTPGWEHSSSRDCSVNTAAPNNGSPACIAQPVTALRATRWQATALMRPDYFEKRAEFRLQRSDIRSCQIGFLNSFSSSLSGTSGSMTAFMSSLYKYLFVMVKCDFFRSKSRRRRSRCHRRPPYARPSLLRQRTNTACMPRTLPHGVGAVRRELDAERGKRSDRIARDGDGQRVPGVGREVPNHLIVAGPGPAAAAASANAGTPAATIICETANTVLCTIGQMCPHGTAMILSLRRM